MSSDPPGPAPAPSRGAGGPTSSSPTTPASHATASSSEYTPPVSFACACLNVRITARLPVQAAKAFTPAAPDTSELPSSTNAGLPVTSPPVAQEGLQAIWMPTRSEKTRLPAFVSYDPELADTDQPGESESERKVDDDEEDEERPAWRTCWICKVKCYRVAGAGVDAPPAAETWVEINPSSGLLYGDALVTGLTRPGLQFSSLILDAPSTSTFGRPPSSTTPTIYANISLPALLPPLPDPFFLPPPFIPSHPKLHELCKEAVESLQVDHHRIEGEIRSYIATRAGEMRSLEDKVRAEVEMLWSRYCEGPGKDEMGLERKRSTSQGRPSTNADPSSRRTSVSTTHAFPPSTQSSSRNRSSQPPQDRTPRPSVDLSLSQPSLGAGTSSASLLSASISANAFHAPPPPSQSRRAPSGTTASVNAPDVFNQLERLSMGERGLDREVAMSYVFSSMDQHMGSGRAGASGPALSGAGAVSARPDPVLESQGEAVEAQPGEGGTAEGEVKGEHDSWIGMERKAVINAVVDERERTEVAEGSLVPVSSQDDGAEIGDEGRTPRPRQVKELHEARERKAKVKFEEPPKEAKAREKERRAVSADGRVDDAEEDYVFDFDMDDMPPADGSAISGTSGPSSSTLFPTSSSPPSQAPERIRPRNIVETNLSRTFAADAPSHRAAWRRIERRDGSMMGALRRNSAPDAEEDEDDDGVEYVIAGRRGSRGGDGGEEGSGASAFATSMPVAIVRPKHLGQGRTMSTVLPPLERKTSLTDSRGVLVPPLIGAMRDRPPTSSHGSTSTGSSNALGLGAVPSHDSSGMTTSKAGTGLRSTSASREREAVQAYTADPGAVFEALADGDDESESGKGKGKGEKKRDGSGDGGEGLSGDGGADVGAGQGLVPGRAFVPPHVIARRESADQPEVGWRSLAS